MATATEKPGDLNNPKQAAQFDAAQELSKNLATRKAERERARNLLNRSLAEAENDIARRRQDWERWERLAALESLSDEARDLGFHLNTPHQEVEDLVKREHRAVFVSRQKLVDAEVEDEYDRDKAEAAVALVHEQFKTELELPKIGPDVFRQAATYGTAFAKVYPMREIRHGFDREIRATELEDGSTVYRFSAPKEVEVAVTKQRLDLIPIYDLRIAPGAKDVESAAWIGDYSYPGLDEILSLKARKVYDGADLREAIEWAQDKLPNGKTASGGEGLRDVANRHMGRARIGRRREIEFQPSPTANLPRFRRFEWWGLYDLHKNGTPVQCVITALEPYEEGASGEAVDHNAPRWIVQVRRNPYFHQLKPYVFCPLIKKAGTVYGMSLMEVTANFSKVEDEMFALGMMQRYLETSPPIEVSEGAGITDEDLQGFLPGKVINVQTRDAWGFVQPPNAAGRAFEMVEYARGKQKIASGVGGPQAAPRVAAVGIINEVQDDDMRLLLYLHGFEHYFVAEAAKLLHGYNRQFLTRDRKVRVLGELGRNVRDIRTVRPTDLVEGIRFEPIVGAQINRRAFQGQALLSMLDRAMVINQVTQQQGRGELIPLETLVRRIFHETFGFDDVDSLVNGLEDPKKVLTPHEEHRLFRQGEYPGVQENENVLLHLRAHIRFWNEGRAADWRPEAQEALLEHIRDTIDQFWREVEAASPGIGDLLAAQFEQELGAEGPANSRYQERAALSQQQNGGRGFAQPGQGLGSPSFRRPNAADISGASATPTAGTIPAAQ